MSRVRIAVVCAAVVLQSAAGPSSIAADNDFVQKVSDSALTRCARTQSSGS